MDRRLVFFAFMLVWDLVDSDRVKKRGADASLFLFKEIVRRGDSHEQ